MGLFGVWIIFPSESFVYPFANVAKVCAVDSFM